MEGVQLGDHVVELAAGTGFFTEKLVRRGHAVTAIDAAPEALALNRHRLGRLAGRVDFQVADLFAWRPARVWDSWFAAFWLCQMPDDVLAGFLETLATAVVSGGTVCVVDKQPDEDSASEHTTRRLSDGRLFTVVDHPRPTSTWVAAFTAASIDLEAEAIGERFLCMRGRRV